MLKFILPMQRILNVKVKGKEVENFDQYSILIQQIRRAGGRAGEVISLYLPGRGRVRTPIWLLQLSRLLDCTEGRQRLSSYRPDIRWRF